MPTLPYSCHSATVTDQRERFFCVISLLEGSSAVWSAAVTALPSPLSRRRSWTLAWPAAQMPRWRATWWPVGTGRLRSFSTGCTTPRRARQSQLFLYSSPCPCCGCLVSPGWLCCVLHLSGGVFFYGLFLFLQLSIFISLYIYILSCHGCMMVRVAWCVVSTLSLIFLHLWAADTALTAAR